MNFKLGRKRPVARPPRLSLKNYMLATLPPPPGTADYTQKAPSSLSNIYKNDQLGDCVIAMGYHLEGVLTGNAGSEYVATDQQIVTDYSAIGGYVPGKPSTDQGAEIPVAINYWQQHGFSSGNKLVGSLDVDATDFNQVMTAIWLFENLLLGVELPDAWINPAPSGSGFTWDVAGPPVPENGHAIAGFAYSGSGVTIATWGMLGLLTRDALAHYFTSASGGECHVVLGPEMIIKASQKAPNGFDWIQLIKDFDALGGSVPVPSPGPTPPPGPTPTPTPPGPTPPIPTPPSPYPTKSQWDAECKRLLAATANNLLWHYCVGVTKALGDKDPQLANNP